MSLHRYEIAVLETLESRKTLSLENLIEACKVGKDGALWAIENLSKMEAVEVKRSIKKEATLSEEGKRYAESHLPEISLINKLEKDKVNINDRNQ